MRKDGKLKGRALRQGESESKESRFNNRTRKWKRKRPSCSSYGNPGNKRDAFLNSLVEQEDVDPTL